MENIIEARIAISYQNGKRLGYYYNKAEFINDCHGIKDFEFGCELFKKGSLLNWKNNEYIVNDIHLEFESILVDGNRITDDNDRIRKTNIVVIIYVEE